MPLKIEIQTPLSQLGVTPAGLDLSSEILQASFIVPVMSQLFAVFFISDVSVALAEEFIF